MLDAQGLTLWRGERRLFHELSFSLQAGHMLLLRGRNGSGKTSLLRVLSGLLPAENGELLLDGVSLRADPAAYARKLGWLGHKDGVKGELSTLRNLAFLLRLAGRAGDERELLERAGLKGLEDRPAARLSYGQRRRLALAGLVGVRAPLWLLDEPDSNLDAQGRSWLMREVSKHLEQGGCAVLAGHREAWDVDAPSAQLILGVGK
ncbi:cytochrome c biogenesis heme-transporting ATPase CcmA [Candidatus Foliamicus sp.]